MVSVEAETGGERNGTNLKEIATAGYNASRFKRQKMFHEP